MKTEQIVLEEILKNIAALPPDMRESVGELAELFRLNIKRAGSPVGEFAIALVGAEMQLDNA